MGTEIRHSIISRLLKRWGRRIVSIKIMLLFGIDSQVNMKLCTFDLYAICFTSAPFINSSTWRPCALSTEEDDHLWLLSKIETYINKILNTFGFSNPFALFLGSLDLRYKVSVGGHILVAGMLILDCINCLIKPDITLGGHKCPDLQKNVM